MKIQDNLGLQYDFEVLPCPLCGNEPEVVTIGNNVTKSRKVKISCKKCGLTLIKATFEFWFEKILHYTIKQWNTRNNKELL